MRWGESMVVNVSRNRGWRRLVAVVAALAVVAPVFAVGTATAGADPDPDPVETFVVGAATRSIDPTVSELSAGVYLGGFGIGARPGRRATGVTAGENLSARALVVRYLDQTMVLVSVDVVGMGNLWMRKIRDGIAAATGISARAIMVNVNHSHSSPDMQGLWGGVPVAYRNRIVSQTVGAVTDAIAAEAPAELRVASVEVTDLHNNRRGESNRDDTMSVMQFRRVSDSSGIATLVNFGLHPTLLGGENLQLSNEFVGPTVSALESAGGGVGLFVNGTLGDLSPRAPEGSGRATVRLGGALAARALTALESAEVVPPGMAMSVKSATFVLGDGSLLLVPVANPDLALAALGIDLRAYYDFTSTGTEYRVVATTTVVRLGTNDDYVSIATFPGEPLSSLGEDVREVVGGKAQFLFALTNDSLGYLLPADEWRPQGSPDPPGRYEETISLERLAGEKIRTAISQAAGSITPIPMVDFVDVPAGASYDQGVDWLRYQQITQGSGARTYSPDRSVKRSEMALFLYRLMGRPEVADPGSRCGFTDLPLNAGAELLQAVCWLKAEEITIGLGGDRSRFGPDGVVDRSQMALFMHRMAHDAWPPERCGFTDIGPAASNELISATCWLKEYGITRGTNQAGTLYAPTQSVTRGQMASFLFRLGTNLEPWLKAAPPLLVW
jgi:hypothetical protein